MWVIIIEFNKKTRGNTQILHMHLQTDGIHIDRIVQEKRMKFDENLVPAKSVLIMIECV